MPSLKVFVVQLGKIIVMSALCVGGAILWIYLMAFLVRAMTGQV